MGKRFTDKTAFVTYISFGWGVAMFSISFVLEGWSMDNLMKLLQSPLGIGGIALAIICVFLFIWNLRREELSPDELVIKRDSRLPELSEIKEKIDEYMRKTYTISRDERLYDIKKYGLGDKPSFATFLTISKGNNQYLTLKNDDDSLGSLLNTVQVISKRVTNSRLDKLINNVIQSEHETRSQQISIRLYRKQYQHTKRNEEKLLKSENIIVFANKLKRLYSYIEMMKRGGDLWNVNTANQKT